MVLGSQGPEFHDFYFMQLHTFLIHFFKSIFNLTLQSLVLHTVNNNNLDGKSIFFFFFCSHVGQSPRQRKDQGDLGKAWFVFYSSSYSWPVYTVCISADSSFPRVIAHLCGILRRFITFTFKNQCTVCPKFKYYQKISTSECKSGLFNISWCSFWHGTLNNNVLPLSFYSLNN